MFPFENLEVYRKASQSHQRIYGMLKQNQSIPSFTKNQFGRASLSVMLNIAEGSAKFSSKDRRNFFITARGSVFECVALIGFLNNEKEITNETKTELYNSYEEISKMLFTMIKNLS
jgi:four helix bundle protein